MVYVYKITRADNLEYIGITKNLNNRITYHQKSKRFSIGIKCYEILDEVESYHDAEILEEIRIKQYNTWKAGLNVTSDGKGLNGNCNFNTLNYKFRDESIKRMSESAKKRGPNNKGIPHKQETKNKISMTKKAQGGTPKKLTKAKVDEIYSLYDSRPWLENANKIKKNGVKMSYEGAFAAEYCNKFEISGTMLKNIITGKSKLWSR
jgi:predicted GIY-YIG superfamily endonuclease